MTCVHVKLAQPTPSTAPPLLCENHPAQRPSITLLVGNPTEETPFSIYMMTKSIRAVGIAGDWKATALEAELWVEMATEGWRRRRRKKR